MDATLEFWKQFLGSPCEHDPTALPNLEDILKISDIPTMEEPIITTELFAYAVSRIKNWKSTGLDCLHGYWIKHLTSLHDHLRCYSNDLLCSKGNTIAPWLLQGKTTLVMKNQQIGSQPSNYRPLTCLPMYWKLFSFMISELIYSHLDTHDLLPFELKGCHKKSRGTKDHLLVDRLIMDNARHRSKNLFMAWIDY